MDAVMPFCVLCIEPFIFTAFITPKKKCIAACQFSKVRSPSENKGKGH